MPNRLIFCFDGTSNDPGDSLEDRGLLSVEDSSITNVLKLHLLFGGDLSGGQAIDGQHSFYFSGVGTHGSKARRIFDTAFALPHLSIDQVMGEAHEIIRERYSPGDEVFLFGFSRGAAVARRFASQLDASVTVRFMGVFDTVASIGKPRLKANGNPASVIVFENGTIAPGIVEALHLVSIDEKRKVFRPTLMNKESRVTEIWLPGVHSDVGGGYRVDGLADSALQLMMEEIDRRGLQLRFLPAAEVDFENLGVDDEDSTIDLDDLIIEPDFLGKVHSRSRTRIIGRLTLEDRLVCVNVGDEPSDELPLVHWSAGERVYGNRDYRPQSLKRVEHLVLLPDGTRDRFSGLAEHLRRGVRQLVHLNVGESRDLFCNALRQHNHSGLAFEAGGKYLFSVPDGQTWTDLNIECGAEGWTRADIEEGFLKEAVIAASEFRRRSPQSNWFALVGAIGETDDEIFEVLEHTKTPYVPRTSGEFCSFANDIRRFYSNNSGSLSFSVTRVE